MSMMTKQIVSVIKDVEVDLTRMDPYMYVSGPRQTYGYVGVTADGFFEAVDFKGNVVGVRSTEQEALLTLVREVEK